MIFFFFSSSYFNYHDPPPNIPVQYPVESPCSLFCSIPPPVLETCFKSSNGNKSLPLLSWTPCRLPYPLPSPSREKLSVGLKSCIGNPDVVLYTVLLLLGSGTGIGMKEFKPLEVNPVRSSKAERWDVVVVVVEDGEEAEILMWFCLLLFSMLLLLGNWWCCWWWWTKWSEIIFLKSWLVAGKVRFRSWPWLIFGFWGCIRSGSLLDAEEVEDVVVEELAAAEEDDDLLFFLEPPPTGMFLRDPPSVQYLLQVLQKYLGCVRL